MEVATFSLNEYNKTLKLIFQENPAFLKVSEKLTISIKFFPCYIHLNILLETAVTCYQEVLWNHNKCRCISEKRQYREIKITTSVKCLHCAFAFQHN